MREQYKMYDKKLNKSDFLRRHSECLPFIGEDYDKTRLLLIGESHYVPKHDIHCVNRPDFYKVSFDELEDGDYKTWISTRAVFEYRVYDRKDFKNFFSNPATEIARVLYHSNKLTKEQRIDAMHQYAFMNYYKRPAYDKGETIRGLTDEDNKYAYEVSKYIIEILNPKLIVFLSKKACNAFYNSDKDDFASKYIVKAVSHPSSQWWNRQRTDEGCGRTDFYNILKEFYQK